MKKYIFGGIAAIVLTIAANLFFNVPMTVSLTVLIALAAIRYLPDLIGQKWTSAVVTVLVLFLMYSTVCWVAERTLPFSTQMKPFGIQSLDNTVASWINRPGVRGEQSLLDSLFRKEEQTDPAEIKKAFKEDPLEAARLLGQQQQDGQVIRDMTNPFKKPVDIAQYRLQRAEKELRDRTLVMQALAKEAKATQIKGTIIKEVFGKDKKKDDVRVFKAGDRVTLASTKAYTKKAVLMVAVYGQDGQISSVPYSCVKFDPIEPEVAKKEKTTPALATAPIQAQATAMPKASEQATILFPGLHSLWNLPAGVLSEKYHIPQGKTCKFNYDSKNPWVEVHYENGQVVKFYEGGGIPKYSTMDFRILKVKESPIVLEII